MARPASPVASSWVGRLLRNILLCIVPVWLVWMALTPLYNRFVITAAENHAKFTCGRRPSPRSSARDWGTAGAAEHPTSPATSTG
jgi:hypothetical protein